MSANTDAGFDRIVASLHDAALGEGSWRTAAAGIAQACGATGIHLVVAHEDWSEVCWSELLAYGEPAPQIEREYMEDYHASDVRPARLQTRPYGRLFDNASLFTERERRTSPVYADFLRRVGGTEQVLTRLRGPDGRDLLLAVTAPPSQGGWRRGDLELFQAVLPHIRHFVRVRDAVTQTASATELPSDEESGLAELLDHAGLGVVALDRRGAVIRANDRAVAMLAEAEGLSDRKLVLQAQRSEENDALGGLVGRALRVDSASGGSMRLSRARGPALTLHMTPVAAGDRPDEARAVALLVDSRHDPDRVAAAFGLRPTESRVAAMLAEGMTVADVAEAMCRARSTVRWHLKRIFRKLRVSRQAELVRVYHGTAAQR